MESDLFAKTSLLPAICQDERTGEILMLGYVNAEALEKTKETKTAWFWSRSRQTLWNKGETSGNVIAVHEILLDCDADTLIYRGVPSGPVCHTGNPTCFYKTLWKKPETPRAPFGALHEMEQVIAQRRQEPLENSYTCYLFSQGLDKILKKVGEEATETILAAKNTSREDLIGEINDLLYHLLVLMNEKEISLTEVERVCQSRAEKIGNLKTFHASDHQS